MFGHLGHDRFTGLLHLGHVVHPRAGSCVEAEELLIVGAGDTAALVYDRTDGSPNDDAVPSSDLTETACGPALMCMSCLAACAAALDPSRLYIHHAAPSKINTAPVLMRAIETTFMTGALAMRVVKEVALGRPASAKARLSVCNVRASSTLEVLSALICESIFVLLPALREEAAAPDKLTSTRATPDAWARAPRYSDCSFAVKSKNAIESTTSASTSGAFDFAGIGRGSLGTIVVGCGKSVRGLHGVSVPMLDFRFGFLRVYVGSWIACNIIGPKYRQKVTHISAD